MSDDEQKNQQRRVHVHFCAYSVLLNMIYPKVQNLVVGWLVSSPNRDICTENILVDSVKGFGSTAQNLFCFDHLTPQTLTDPTEKLVHMLGSVKVWVVRFDVFQVLSASRRTVL